MAWAQRHRERVGALVCSGAPMYPDEVSARAAIAGANPMGRLLLIDERWAQRACAFNCANRTASGWLAAALEPSVPVAIARYASLHTWPAYRQALEAFVLRTDWQHHLDALRSAGTSLTLIWGTDDRIGDRAFAASLVRGPGQSIVAVAGADHHLPITHPEEILGRLPAHD